MQSNLYYWRDNTGNEIDVIIDEGLDLLPVEIKAGKTMNKRLLKNLLFWEKLTEKQKGVLVYGGDEDQQRSNDINVKSWRNVANL